MTIIYKALCKSIYFDFTMASKTKKLWNIHSLTWSLWT